MRHRDHQLGHSGETGEAAVDRVPAGLEAFHEIAFQRRRDPVNEAEVRRFDASRRAFLKSAVTAGLFSGPMGAGLAAVLTRPAAADTALDIQILQTASALESVCVSTYLAALDLPSVKRAEGSLRLLLQTTANQHAEHGTAFRAQSKALGGAEQGNPHPAVHRLVTDALDGVDDLLQMVQLAEQVETIATHTYLDAIAQLDDDLSRRLMATIMGVESQHAGLLRGVASLLSEGSARLVAIPVDPAALPASFGSVATPDAVELATKAVEPDSGALSGAEGGST